MALRLFDLAPWLLLPVNEENMFDFCLLLEGTDSTGHMFYDFAGGRDSKWRANTVVQIGPTGPEEIQCDLRHNHCLELTAAHMEPWTQPQHLRPNHESANRACRFQGFGSRKAIFC